MEKPKYIEKAYAIVFLCLGSVFIFMGLLCFVGILKPTEHSYIQDLNVMGFCFVFIGVTFCILQILLRAIDSAKNKLHTDLLDSGTKLNGTVEKVYVQSHIHYGKKSQKPFRIRYTYDYQGKVYHHKSHLLWSKPNLNIGDSMVIYVNDLGKSTINM